MKNWWIIVIIIIILVALVYSNSASEKEELISLLGQEAPSEYSVDYANFGGKHFIIRTDTNIKVKDYEVIFINSSTYSSSGTQKPYSDTCYSLYDVEDNIEEAWCEIIENGEGKIEDKILNKEKLTKEIIYSEFVKNLKQEVIESEETVRKEGDCFSYVDGETSGERIFCFENNLLKEYEYRYSSFGNDVGVLWKLV